MAASKLPPNQANLSEDHARSRHCPISTLMDWNKCRKDIETFYCDRGWPLRKVMKAVKERHGHSATGKQYKDQITKWGLGKNLHQDDIAPLIRFFQRAENDPARPRVVIRGRTIKRPRLAAYLKRKGRSEDEVLAATNANQPTPDYIKLEYAHIEASSTDAPLWKQLPESNPLTPATPSAITTHSAFLSHHSTRFPTPESQGAKFGECSVLDFKGQGELLAASSQEGLKRSNTWQQQRLQSSHASDPDMSAAITELADHKEASNISSRLDACVSYNIIIERMLRPDSPAGSRSSELNTYRLLSGWQQVSSQEELIRSLDHPTKFPDSALEGTERHDGSTDLSQKFLACFFGGCTLHSQNSREDAARLFRDARNLLEAMIRECHPDCLTALNVMLSVAEAHYKTKLVGKVLSTALVLPPKDLTNPVAASVDFMVRVATRRQKDVEVEIAELQSTHEQLEDQFGAESPSALVGLYHFAWMCAKADQHRERALQTLVGLIPSVKKRLGSSHFLTITCMTVMARVLSYIRTVQESISVMREALWAFETAYAPFHPYRLEVLYRLSQFLIDAQQPILAEEILREVVEQRVNVLERGNRLTTRSREKLLEVLKLTGKKISSEDLASGMLSNSTANEADKTFSLQAYLPTISPPPALAGRV